MNETSDFDFSVYAIHGNAALNHYTLKVEVNGVQITTLCDTGAPCSLMSANTFDAYFDRKVLQQCSVPYTGYTGNLINIIGEFKACVNFNGQKIYGKFVVTNTDRPTLLGRDFLRSLGFELTQSNLSSKKESFSSGELGLNSNTSNVTSKSNSVNYLNTYNEIIEQIKAEFAEVFQSGLGKYNISTISLPISKDAVPVFFKPRPIPIAWRETVEKKLDELVDKGMLVSVDNSDWGTPLVPLLKPSGEIRICGDYKVTINKYLSDFRYPLPRIDQIFASMEGGSLNSADSLSRIGQIENPDTKPESTYINYVNFVNPLQLDFLAIAKYTRRDAILSKVANSILNGTLLNLGGNEFNAFKTKASELTVESGCILWGYRTVIPSKLQGNVLQELHKSHL
ncbi:uncharacterized protein K02A2.6-like, partial [Rhagoletis pomonella]|uniref:uncharacterized protein K02A2.6-like n=1 Tax=Rhagoletis pomonella TaxID=28610 RepID=UPI00177BAD0F